MGCLAPKPESLTKTLIYELTIQGKKIQILTGNPYDEMTQVLLVLTNDMAKFDLKVINKESLRLMGKCFDYLKSRNDSKAIREIQQSTSFAVNGSLAEKVVFVEVPWYIDGTFAEDDKLESCLSGAFQYCSFKKINFYIDCTYPRSKFVKAFLTHLSKLIKAQDPDEIKIFANDIQIVIFIQRFLLNIHSVSAPTT